MIYLTTNQQHFNNGCRCKYIEYDPESGYAQYLDEMGRPIPAGKDGKVGMRGKWWSSFESFQRWKGFHNNTNSYWHDSGPPPNLSYLKVDEDL